MKFALSFSRFHDRYFGCTVLIKKIGEKEDKTTVSCTYLSLLHGTGNLKIGWQPVKVVQTLTLNDRQSDP